MASESSLSNSEAIALKALSGVGLAIFTALMVVHWNHVLSKVQTAEETAPQTKTATTAPPSTPSTTTTAATLVPSTSTSSVAPPATTTSAIATNSTTSTPTSPVTASTVAPITTATPTAPSAAGAPIATTVETAPAKPMTTTAASTPVTNAIASSTTESTAPANVEALKAKLYQTLDQGWTEYPTFSQDLVYKVTVSGDGEIVDYQPIHQTAIDYLNETPLDGISTNSAASGTDFMVVMTPSGILEVNPWIGK